MKISAEIIIIDDRMKDCMPSYSTSGSAAMDLRASLEKSVTVKPGKCELIGTGIAIHLANPAYAGMILPRSGLGHNRGLILGNGTGLIDSDYTGELKVSCFNRVEDPITIEPLMRFAQYVIIPVIQLDLKVVDRFTKQAERGDGGFGSTGQN